MPEAAPFHERTEGEKQAYVDGYKAALNLVEKHDLKTAASGLSLIESSLRHPEELDDGPGS